MNKSRKTESQIMEILKQAESGVPIPDLCREHSMSTASFLQMAGQIRRHGRIHDQANERT